MRDFFKSNKFLIILFVASLATLAIGVMMIVNAPVQQPAVADPQSQSEVPLSDSLDTSTDIIHNSQQSTDSLTGEGVDISTLERGSEKWCDALMQEPDTDWSEADTQLFGKKCI